MPLGPTGGHRRDPRKTTHADSAPRAEGPYATVAGPRHGSWTEDPRPPRKGPDTARWKLSPRPPPGPDGSPGEPEDRVRRRPRTGHPSRLRRAGCQA